MAQVSRYALQIFNYSIFIIILWYFSAAPAYQHLAPAQALIALSFSHAGKPIEECQQLTPEELAALTKLPSNKRNPKVCPRQRSPIEVKLFMDDQLLFSKTFQPHGFSGDWGVDVYRQFKVPSGQHHLKVQLKDSVRVKDFNYVHKAKVVLKPAQLLIIGFQPESGFIIQ